MLVLAPAVSPAAEPGGQVRPAGANPARIVLAQPFPHHLTVWRSRLWGDATPATFEPSWGGVNETLVGPLALAPGQPLDPHENPFGSETEWTPLGGTLPPSRYVPWREDALLTAQVVLTAPAVSDLNRVDSMSPANDGASGQLLSIGPAW